MLVYHPMFDPYHAALRMACVLMDLERSEIEWDRLRLMDFYVVFPHLLSSVRLPQELRAYRKLLNSIPQPYEEFPGAGKLFFQLSVIQETGARLLVAGGLLDAASLIGGQAKLIRSATLPRLRELGEKLSFRGSAWYEFLMKQISRMPLGGRNGLKERSGLMEFRHDPVV